jgi:hypothetical protein
MTIRARRNCPGFLERPRGANCAPARAKKTVAVSSLESAFVTDIVIERRRSKSKIKKFKELRIGMPVAALRQSKAVGKTAWIAKLFVSSCSP